MRKLKNKKNYRVLPNAPPRLQSHDRIHITIPKSCKAHKGPTIRIHAMQTKANDIYITKAN